MLHLLIHSSTFDRLVVGQLSGIDRLTCGSALGETLREVMECDLSSLALLKRQLTSKRR